VVRAKSGVGRPAVPRVAGLLLSRPAVASAIIGAETEEEVTANATAADITLDSAQLDALTALPAGEDS
jgi:aryl-alcohol dehydrogenase-like predicted oxidoreductase